MPVRLDIVDFKCFNQLRNGENFDINLGEFTPNLVGNIGEKVKVEYGVNVQQTAFTEGVEEWFIIVDPPFRQIERSSGSFIDDGVQVGDVYVFYTDWLNRRGSSGEYSGIVDFVSSDGKVIRYTLDTGSDTTVGVQTNVGLGFVLSGAPLGNFAPNLNTAAFLRFGLLSNDETFNFLSKTTGGQQVYYVGELVKGDPAKAAESLGSIKDWVSGEVSVEFTNIQPDFLGAQYIVSHEFVLNPFYILSFREFIQNGTIPDLLAGDSSLKYAPELEFRKALTDTIAPKMQSFDGLDGFVGWYGENFNGLNKKYEVLSIAYEESVSTDPLDGVNINTATKATIVVSDVGGAITDYSCSVYIFRVPDSEDDYIGTTTNLVENFILKSDIVSSPATTSPNVVTSLSGGDLIIEYTIDYTVAEKLQLTTDDEYILLVQVEDPTISAGNSDRVMLIADFRNYVDVDFLAGFVNVPQYDILQHPQELGDGGSFIQILSNEDGILLDAVIGTDTSKGVIINSISLNLLAYDPVQNKSFNLDVYNFNIGDLVLTGSSQQIEVNTTRGYPLPVGDDFNLVRITTEGLAGDFQQYAIQIGQKIKWQDWIFNPSVDNVFFDASQLNNNLNEKSSNYSDENNYQIRLALIVNVSGLDDLGRSITGDFINYGLALTVNDYDESEDGVTGVIQTFDVETGNSLEGNILYNGKDTLFKAVFQDAGAMQYGIHRIEPSQNQGDGIFELSSVKPSVPNNLLKPIDGETLLKFDLVGSVLTTECLIDGSLIQEGVQYKLSARAAQEPLVLVNPFTFTIDTTIVGGGSSGANDFQIPFISSGTYNAIVDKGNGDPLLFINTWDDAQTLLNYAIAGVYEVKIYGTVLGWQFNNGADQGIDKDKITDISQWGILQPGGPSFFGCTNLDVTATDTPDLSGTTDLFAFFGLCSSLVYNPSIDTWDTSTILTTTSCFVQAVLFNQPVGSWDMSNVTNAQNMFNNANTFNQPLNTWVTDSLVLAAGMFNGADVFNQPIGNWNMSNVTSMASMFTFAADFNQDLHTWVTTSLTNVNQMFDRAFSFNGRIDGWDVSNVSSFFNFIVATDFNQSLAGTFAATFAATNVTGMFSSNTNFNQDVTVLGFGTVLNATSFLNNCAAFDQNLAALDVSNLVNGVTMLGGTTALSTANYDATLVGWDSQTLQSGVTVDFGGSTFTTGGAGDIARTNMVTSDLWTILDGGGV